MYFSWAAYISLLKVTLTSTKKSWGICKNWRFSPFIISVFGAFSSSLSMYNIWACVCYRKVYFTCPFFHPLLYATFLYLLIGSEIPRILLNWTILQLILIPLWQGCWSGTNVIWRVSGMWALKKAKALQKQKGCFSWKLLHWTRRMLKMLLRLSSERFTAMSAGRSWIQIVTKLNYLSTG